MRILVTGAAGFIGSTLTDRLIADGHDVVGVDDMSTGKMSNLAAARAANKERRGAFSLTKLSIVDPSFLDVVAKARPEVICHLAAQMDVRKSVADPVFDATVNVVGTINVLEAARRAGVRKVVFTSSGGSIYGSQTRLPVSERVRPAPESPYAASKASGELYLHAFQKMYGLEYTSLALANVYGPRQDPHGEAGVVAIFGTALLTGKPTKVFGDGGNTRDYVFVDDVVEAFVRACGPGGNGRRLNIGTGVQTTDRGLHTVVAAAAGAPDDPEYAPPRIGDARSIALECAAARQALGWEPWTRLADGVQATVDWLRTTL
ncbi:MAG TPA: NAD-dependent epimerase/dehydratase family protein [Mycobacteriales bacterium]